MREADFKKWLQNQEYARSTISTQLTSARKLRDAYGDLDTLYDEDKFESLTANLKYSADDQRKNKENPTPMKLWGNTYRDLAHIRATVGYYKRFRENIVDPRAGIPLPDVAAVERAIDECEKIGVSAFMDAYRFSRSNVRYWVVRNDKEYPSKAIFAVAFQFMPEGTVLDSKLTNGTEAHQHLSSLGFVIREHSSFQQEDTTGNEETASERRDAKPQNLVLFGPPGTGKTYKTIAEAVKLCDSLTEEDSLFGPDSRSLLRDRYLELVKEKRISFVTFHQNYSYEEFVEGLRPDIGDDIEGVTEVELPRNFGSFKLNPFPGTFRKICDLAEQARKNTRNYTNELSGFDLGKRRVWKMSLGFIGNESTVYDRAVKNNYIVLGWGGDEDWSDARFDDSNEIEAEWKSTARANDQPSNYIQLSTFRNEMKKGDIVIVPYGNSNFRAIGEVTGDYFYEPTGEETYNHKRRVKWLSVLDREIALDTIITGKFTMRSVYEISRNRINMPALARFVTGKDDSKEAAARKQTGANTPEQFVLIIDEINRANISKVFGELITLIEPDKRLGMSEAIKTILPYSRQEFGVPANLHIIGTMNTADRSIALLDTALRRRFRFEEIEPEPELLLDVEKLTGVPLVRVLYKINDRIEYLVDRDHRIGHAFFMDCVTRSDVDAVMRDRIIPLLQEYFFEDWSKAATVLGEKIDFSGLVYKGGFLACRKLKDPSGESREDRRSWSVLPEFSDNAFEMLLGNNAASLESEILPQ